MKATHEPGEDAVEEAERLIVMWDRNDEDLGSITVRVNLEQALDKARLEGLIEGVSRFSFPNNHLRKGYILCVGNLGTPLDEAIEIVREEFNASAKAKEEK